MQIDVTEKIETNGSLMTFTMPLPQPTGYRLLVKMKEAKSRTQGGLHIPENVKKLEDTASIVAQVIQMGPEAYSDKDKFPKGPWCKDGDFIVMRSYSGTRVGVSGTEYRIINDDMVEAVVPDPEAIERAY